MAADNPSLLARIARGSQRKRLGVVALLLVPLGLSLAWAWVSYFAAPPPSGEPYRAVSGWPQLPEDIHLGQVSGVGVNSHGQVLVFRRAERAWQGGDLSLLPAIPSTTVLVLESATGKLLNQWGANMFVLPHCLTIDHEDNVWLTDVGLHQVFKFDPAGQRLLTLGERGVPGDDSTHFNQPTDVAVAPDGTFYVSDGYGNSRIVKFSPEGKFLLQWGSKGTAPGEFDLPHSLALDTIGQVYVADRGNARLQIFDGTGHFVAEWKGKQLGRPWAVRIDTANNVYLVDGGDQPILLPDRARILKLDGAGQVLASFGAYGRQSGEFIWPHAIALGQGGELYVGEVSTGMRVQKFIRADMPAR